MDAKMKDKKAQVAMFVIIAIFLLVAVFLILFFTNERIRNIFIPSTEGIQPSDYITSCVKDSVYEAVNIMLPQGGWINPQLYELYHDDKIGYLCYTTSYYSPCVMQEPMYITFLENEITDYIEPTVESCFQSLKQELENNQYQVSLEAMNLETELTQDQIRIEIKRDLTMSRTNQTIRYEEFDVNLPSPLYNLGIVAQEIASQEAEFCNFEQHGFNMFYPEFDITKDTVDSDIELYFIEHKSTGKKMNLAIRSCAMYAGFSN